MAEKGREGKGREGALLLWVGEIVQIIINQLSKILKNYQRAIGELSENFQRIFQRVNDM